MSPSVRGARVRHVDRCAARAVLFALLALYTATTTGLPDNPDGEVAFQTTRSLALHGSLAIRPETPEARRILDHARAAAPGGSSVRAGTGSRADRHYAWFGIGQPLVAVPFFLAGRALGATVLAGVEREHERLGHYGMQRSELIEHLAVGWLQPLAGAMTAWLIVLCALRLGASRRSAVVAAVAYGVTTFAWPQARSSLSDVPAAFWLTLAVHLLLRVREGYERLHEPRRRELLGLGAALGMAALTRVALVAAVGLLAAWAVIVVVKGNRKLASTRWVPGGGGRAGLREAAWLGAPLLVAGGSFLAANAWRFGSPWDSGYGTALADGRYFAFPVWRGLAGLLLSPGRGLLCTAPGVVCALLGLGVAWRRGERAWPLVTCAVGLAVALPVAHTTGWHGGWTFGPRYLLPWLPLLWLGFALAWPALIASLAGRWLVGATLVLGFLVQFPAVLVDTMTVHDLSVRAAREVWPGTGDAPGDEDAARFENAQWHPGFAAPWVHWRILRHRVAGLPESFAVNEIFRAEGPASDLRLRPSFGRDEGFRHFAWIDLQSRLRFPLWIPLLGIGLLLLVALREGARAAGTP